MTIVATLKRHYCTTVAVQAAQAALLRHKQQHRNVLAYLTEAKDAASWGRQAPSLPPGDAPLLRHRRHYCATGCGHWVESLSRYTLNGYLLYTPAWQR